MAKTDPPFPFLVSQMVTPKDIATKSGDMIDLQSRKLSRRSVSRRRDICNRTDTK